MEEISRFIILVKEDKEPISIYGQDSVGSLTDHGSTNNSLKSSLRGELTNLLPYWS